MNQQRGARRALLAAVLASAFLFVAGCGTSAPASPLRRVRTYRMGFSAIPPRLDQSVAIKAIELWSRRADAAIVSLEPPWAELLAGVDPAALVSQVQVPLGNHYRTKGHELWVYLDPANGLDRAGESDALVSAGRSLTEAAVQQLFRRYAVEMDRQLHPEHMGLTLETNLIRGLSPPALTPRSAESPMTRPRT